MIVAYVTNQSPHKYKHHFTQQIQHNHWQHNCTTPARHQQLTCTTHTNNANSDDRLDSIAYFEPPFMNPNNNLINGRKLNAPPQVPIVHQYNADIEYKYIDDIIELHRQDNGFGFRIIGGKEEGSQVAIGYIVPNGSADLDGRLKPNDEIIKI